MLSSEASVTGPTPHLVAPPLVSCMTVPLPRRGGGVESINKKKGKKEKRKD